MASNAEMIFAKEIDLAQKGLIPTTERKITVNLGGKDVEMNEPTHIHTASGWRSKGYLVRKGEHAVASIPIWHNTNVRPDENAEPDENGAVKASRMQRKTSYFFSAEQVAPIEDALAEGAAA